MWWGKIVPAVYTGDDTRTAVMGCFQPPMPFGARWRVRAWIAHK
ncbi:hypothetical protein NITLEN_90086 [Nitrospira lenta]|uniref:Uncharacterized protein n=1 Tax=Nitrospira lenta TaxID=1436998 RepID=A0A330LBV9_9BACT|nr:hypothetical protein NITLEN_90086 [Nitrospira lenta]